LGRGEGNKTPETLRERLKEKIQRTMYLSRSGEEH